LVEVEVFIAHAGPAFLFDGRESIISVDIATKGHEEGVDHGELFGGADVDTDVVRVELGRRRRVGAGVS